MRNRPGRLPSPQTPAPRRASALVGAPARQHPLDANRARRAVDLDDRAPIPDPQPRLRAALEPDQLLSWALRGEPLKLANDPRAHGRIQPAQILAGRWPKNDPPTGATHSIPNSRLISSRGIEGAGSSSASRTALSSSAVQGSSCLLYTSDA